MNGRKQSVFISYAREDGRQVAERLYESLRSQGIRAWFDRRSLDPHQDFSGEIEIAMEQATHAVICLSPSIADRKDSFVRREIIYAQGCDIPITPILLPEFPKGRVPVTINHLTWLTFWRESSPSKLDFNWGLVQLLERVTESANAMRQSSDDPFRKYLDETYRNIVHYLDQTVFSLLSIAARESSDVVQSVTSTVQLPVSFLATALTVRNTSAGVRKRFANIEEAFEQAHGRLLLLGDPGAGKTTTLMAFARDAIARRLEDATAPLPLVGRVADWAASDAGSIAGWLSASLGLPKRKVRQEVSRGNVLFLLDGLDELAVNVIPDKKRGDGRTRFLRDLERSVGQNQVLLSSRKREYQVIGHKVSLNAAVSLEELEDEKLANYLIDYPHLARAIANDDELSSMVRTPLLLSLLTFAFADSQNRANDLANLSASPGELREKIFDIYVRRRFEHEQLRANTDMKFSLDQVHEILGQAAVESQDYAFGPNDRSGTPIENVLRDCLGDRADAFLSQVMRLHLLVRNEQGSVRFIHLLIRDFFGFRIAMDRLPNGGPLSAQAKMFLGGTSDNRVVGALLGEDGRGERDIHSIFALQAFPDSRALLYMARLLSDGGQWYRDDYYSWEGAYGVESCARAIGISIAVEALESAMAEENPSDRASYALALGILNTDEAVQPLLDALQDTCSVVRACAIHALGQLRARPDVTAAIEELIDDDSRFERPAYAKGPRKGRVGDLASAYLKRL